MLELQYMELVDARMLMMMMMLVMPHDLSTRLIITAQPLSFFRSPHSDQVTKGLGKDPMCVCVFFFYSIIR